MKILMFILFDLALNVELSAADSAEPESLVDQVIITAGGQRPGH